MAGVSFGVLGNGETCTGDPARRAGNEFVFQGLAQQNVETLQGVQGQEGRLDLRPLLQHAQERVQGLRHRARGRAPHPAAQPAGARGQADPGHRRRRRREALDHLPRPVLHRPPQRRLHARRASCCRSCPAPSVMEMARNSERSFCCGAGGARMWMEENIGERINVNRTKEAVATGADQIAVGCPFCRVMLSDGLTAAAGQGRGPRGGRGPRRRADAARVGEGRGAPTKLPPRPAPPAQGRRRGAAAGAAGAAPAARAKDEATRPSPRPATSTQTEETVTDTEDVGPLAKASGGTSLFDDPGRRAGGVPARRASRRRPSRRSRPPRAARCSTSGATSRRRRRSPRRSSPRRRSRRRLPSRGPPSREGGPTWVPAGRCSTSVATSRPPRPSRRRPSPRPEAGAREVCAPEVGAREAGEAVDEACGRPERWRLAVRPRGACRAGCPGR